MSSVRYHFITGAVSGAGGFVLKAVSNVLLIPLIMHYLGTQSFGIFVFILSFSELLLMLDAGLTSGLIHRLSYFLSIKDSTGFKEHLFLGHWLYTTISILLMIIGCLILWQQPVIFADSSLPVSEVSLLLCLTFIEAAFNLYGCFYQSILKSHCLHLITNVVDSSRLILSNLWAVLLLIMGFDLTTVIAVKAVMAGLSAFTLLFICFRQKYLQPVQLLKRPVKLSVQKFEKLTQISLWSMLQRVSVFMSLKANDFIVATFLTLSDMALYGLVYRIFTQVLQFCFKLLEGLSPVFIRFLSSDEDKKSKPFYLRMTNITSFIAGGFLITLLMLLPETIDFMGQGQINWQDTVTLSLIFSGIVFVGASAFPASNYLFSAEQQRFLTSATVVFSLLSLGASLFFVKQYGVLAVAASILVAQLLKEYTFVLIKTKRMLSVSTVELVNSILLLNLPSFLLLMLSFYSVRHIGFTQLPLLHYLLSILVSLAGCLGAATLWFQLALSSYEKALLQPFIARQCAKLLPFLPQSLQLKSEGG